jgi:hypothetical protein
MFFRPRTTRIPFDASAPGRGAKRRLQRIEMDVADDAHARAAIEAYADSCAADMPWLAEWLREAAGPGARELGHCGATVRRVFGLAQRWAAARPDYAHGAWEHVRGHLEAALNSRAASRDKDEAAASLPDSGA